MCMYGMDMGHTFRADSSSAPANTIAFRPCLSHPPAGTNGTTPCGVGNAMRPGPGVAPRRRNPGLYGTTPLALGAGNREWAWVGCEVWGWAWIWDIRSGRTPLPRPRT